ncbi:MAG TPA: FAD-dependent oxidoreductase [Woeseiaceae bacterium]|nr:FAD-dependent oxidoreductase [Woeseiaceae bacterium]
MPSDTDPGVVIVGGGHAAVQLAQGLRRLGWQRGVTIVGEEPVLPYHRPPLSKDFLKGRKRFEQILIRQESAYARDGIRLVLGRRVDAIDRAGKSVRLDDGSSLDYEKLVLSCGASPRRLPVPGIERAGVCYVRTIADIERMRAAVEPGGRALVVGAGYIGLEAAASLRALQMNVTVLETQERVLKRVTGPIMSDFFARLHREEGVQVRLGASVTAIHGDERVRAVELGSGSVEPIDLVVIGIGIVPNVALAEASGLDVNDGIVVDQHCRTTDPDIHAVGDCASFLHPRYGRSMRLESVQHANDQAMAAAKALCGAAEPYATVPWFWSDQFDVKLQIAGLSDGHDLVVERGDSTRGRSFTLCYVKNDRLLAVDAVNRPKDFVAARKLVADSVKVDPARIANPELPLDAAVLQ